MNLKNATFYEKFSMQDNSYTDESDRHYTFLVGECEGNSIYADTSGYVTESGDVSVYFNDDKDGVIQGYIQDEYLHETMIDLPFEIADKIGELTEQAIMKDCKQHEMERSE